MNPKRATDRACEARLRNLVTSDGASEAIPFDELVGWADGTQYHRYVVTLFHPPLQRNERAPAHRFLWIEWGTAWKPRTRGATTLRFSHRDTAAAAALRRALESRGADHRALTLIEVPGRGRTQGSFALLRPEAPGEDPEG